MRQLDELGVTTRPGCQLQCDANGLQVTSHGSSDGLEVSRERRISIKSNKHTEGTGFRLAQTCAIVARESGVTAA